MKELFKDLKKMIRENERAWNKDIKNTKNPIFRMMKQDYKDLVEIESKLIHLNLMYGISLKLEFPEPTKGHWQKLNEVQKLSKKLT